MWSRFKIWLWARLLAADQTWHVRVAFFTYVLAGRGSPPDPDETISSRVGRAAIKGKPWALRCERVLDWLFSPWESNHCRNSVEHWLEIKYSVSSSGHERVESTPVNICTKGVANPSTPEL